MWDRIRAGEMMHDFLKWMFNAGLIYVIGSVLCSVLLVGWLVYAFYIYPKLKTRAYLKKDKPKDDLSLLGRH